MDLHPQAQELPGHHPVGRNVATPKVVTPKSIDPFQLRRMLLLSILAALTNDSKAVSAKLTGGGAGGRLIG